MKPILDVMIPEPSVRPPVDLEEQAPPPDSFLEQCRSAYERFKFFVRGTACCEADHAHAVVRSHYPSMDMGCMASGFAADVADERIALLQSSSVPMAEVHAGDLQLFSKDPTEGGA